MHEFSVFLEKEGITESVIKERLKHVTDFLNWCERNKVVAKEMTYLELMDFIGYLQTKPICKASINHRLMSLTHYYLHKEWENVVSGVRLRGIKKEQVLLFTSEELDQIYESWEEPTENGYFRYTNKLILGLIIYQGLVTSDILGIELADINLEKGTLYIKGRARQKRNRTLTLERFQILAFYDYIQNYRGIRHPLQIGITESNKLFSPNCDKRQRLEGQLKTLSKTLKKKHKDFVKLSQFQQSRLTIWIEKYGLRKAQYLSGYRSIDKVEKYKAKNMKDLSEQIKQYHPLK